MFVFWSRSIKSRLKIKFNSFERDINSFEKENINSIVKKQKKIRQFNWKRYQQLNLKKKISTRLLKKRKIQQLTLRKISNLEREKEKKKHSYENTKSASCHETFNINDVFNAMKHLIQCDQINNNNISNHNITKTINFTFQCSTIQWNIKSANASAIASSKWSTHFIYIDSNFANLNKKYAYSENERE